jgi:hypothetical protein
VRKPKAERTFFFAILRVFVVSGVAQLSHYPELTPCLLESASKWQRKAYFSLFPKIHIKLAANLGKNRRLYAHYIKCLQATRNSLASKINVPTIPRVYARGRCGAEDRKHYHNE